jgi:hypothetical protein
MVTPAQAGVQLNAAWILVCARMTQWKYGSRSNKIFTLSIARVPGIVVGLDRDQY